MVGERREAYACRSVLETLAFGVFAEIRPDTSGVSISLQPELLFVTKGAGVTLAGEGADVSADLTISYLQAPLLIEYPLKGGNVEGQLYNGAYVAYAVRRRLGVEAEEPVSEATAARLDAFRERWDYGVVLGAKIDTELFGVPLNYEIRYDFDLARLGGDALNARLGTFSLLFETDLTNLSE